MKLYRFYLPLIVAASIILGLWVGFYLANKLPSNNIEFILPSSSSNKLSKIINYIDENYVDTVAKDRLIDKAIRQVLEELDPHSYYISREDYQAMNEPLEGNFEGVGIEFVIRKDTLFVVQTIEGGPSEEAGLRPGDKIVMVDGDTIAGIGLRNSDVVKLLRGEKGSEVNVHLKRKGKPEWISKTITRGKIPIKSVAGYTHLNDTTGYIKISRFAKTTHEEFLVAMDSLKGARPEMKHLVLDLRNNGGGFLEAAIKICEDLLSEDQLIVYTQGKSEKKKEYYSKKDGKYRNLNLSVLINEFSASASEIVAGAIQDHDRGTIIGRRSFGKGLVQEQLSLNDRSALRLTVARYYTPTGRCIQKPYGGAINYDDDYQERYFSGELFYEDSMPFVDSLKYLTPKGKTVYGGGGIIPDLFIPLDTNGRSEVLSTFLYYGAINAAAFSFANSERTTLKEKGLDYFVQNFEVPQEILDALISDTGLDKSQYNALSVTQKKAISERFKSNVARHIWKERGLYKNSVRHDEMLDVLLLEKQTSI